MRHCRASFIALIIVPVIVGCGGGKANAPPESIPTDYLRGIKSHILNLQQAAAQNSATVAGQLESVVENLEDSKHEDLKDHGPTIEKLKTAAKELQDLVKGSPQSPQVRQKVDEMAKVASTLPGDVTMEGTGSDARAPKGRDF